MKTFPFNLILFFSLVLLNPLAVYAKNPPVLAPGYNPLAFDVPKPGSYQLPPLGYAANGQVVNTENQDTQLHALMGDKIVLLSFIYSTCSDINGCPLATAVFHQIKNRLKKEPLLSDKLRLLTLSFNPQHDTPEAMQHYAKGLQDSTLDWQFLTTHSETQLQPILQHYRQSIQKVTDERGEFNGTFSHILRVYLIDKDKQLRNIYSVSFLHADTLINDIKTLLIEPVKTEISSAKKPEKNHLLKTIQQPPLGLPKVPVPSNNPVTVAKINLGKKLFFDRRLSGNGTFSCAMCHIPEQGFSSNEMATAVGVEGRSVKRNSPTIYNVGYYQTLFHDGRESTLENQVWGPLLAANEMANPSIGFVIDTINQLDDYQDLFENVFDRPASMETISFAIASYERSLNSADSNFDRWLYGKQKNAISHSAKQGYTLFTGKAKCSSCHTLSSKNALFTDNQFHNTGVGYSNVLQTPIKQTTKVQLAPGVFTEVENQIIDSVSEPKSNDLGRYEITKDPADRWKFKTPSLRNIKLTAPYMHNGSFSTLRQVITFYNQGGISNVTLDPLIQPLSLSDQEIDYLIDFLKTLTGNNNHELYD